MHRAAQAYMQTGVSTTGQGEILLMLYDGAIKFINRAKVCLNNNDMAGKGNNITKTLDIIQELQNTLDMEKGGSLAENLRNLYIFCSNRLVMANIKKSTEILDEVLKVIIGLRSAFASIVDLPEAREAAEQAAASQHHKAAGSGRHVGAPGSSGTLVGPSAPGASARQRNMYARNMQVPSAPSAASEPAGHTEEAGNASSVAAETVEVAAQAPVESLNEPAALPVQSLPETPPVSLEEDLLDAFETALPPAAGFGAGKLAASSMYRKMSQS